MRKRTVTAIVLVMLTLSSLAASALAGPREDKHWVCHGTASATNPYVLIWIDGSALPAHLGAPPYTVGEPRDDAHGHRNHPDIYMGQGGRADRPDVSECTADVEPTATPGS